jgi:hypothetical protein
MDWREGRPVGGRPVHPRDPPFRPPVRDDAHSVISRGPSQASTGRSGHRRGEDEDEDDADSQLQSPFADPRSYRTPGTYGAPRSSMETYGAFSDPPPSGYAGAPRSQSPAGAYDPPRSPRIAVAQPAGISRTMALAYEDTGASDTRGTRDYEDPYDRVRAAVTRPPSAHPPSYSEYRLS